MWPAGGRGSRCTPAREREVLGVHVLEGEVLDVLQWERVELSTLWLE